MAVILEVNASEIPDNATPGVVEKWDSLGHMNLIVAVEEEFVINFSDGELIQLISLDLIVAIVSDKLKEQM